MKHIDWTNPAKIQLDSLLNVTLFRESLGPNGPAVLTYKAIEQEQLCTDLILEFAVAFETRNLEEFNEALKDLSPIISNPHGCLMVNPKMAQEALMSAKPVRKKRHPLEEDSDENY